MLVLSLSTFAFAADPVAPAKEGEAAKTEEAAAVKPDAKKAKKAAKKGEEKKAEEPKEEAKATP